MQVQRLRQRSQYIRQRHLLLPQMQGCICGLQQVARAVARGDEVGQGEGHSAQVCSGAARVTQGGGAAAGSPQLREGVVCG